MCILTNMGNFGGDTPELECDNCDMRFSLVWNRNPVYTEPEYCPFCGDEVEEIIWEEEVESDD